MKKILCAVCVCFVSLVTLTSCGSGGNNSSVSQSSNQTENTAPAEIDLDAAAASLTAGGYFPDTLEQQDPAGTAGTLCLYEDRIEAAPEDLTDSRYFMALGMVADQFMILRAADDKAADRLEKALNTYAEDQKSAFEFYSPDEAYRFDDPVIERGGNYLIFAIGSDRDSLEELCERLLNGEA